MCIYHFSSTFSCLLPHHLKVLFLQCETGNDLILLKVYNLDAGKFQPPSPLFLICIVFTEDDVSLIGYFINYFSEKEENIMSSILSFESGIK